MAWCCAVRQQGISWAIDPDLCHHMASLGHNELTNAWLCNTGMRRPFILSIPNFTDLNMLNVNGNDNDFNVINYICTTSKLTTSGQLSSCISMVHYDVIKWKYFPHYWPFVQVTGEFPAQRPVTQSFDVFFDLCLNNHRAHYDATVMAKEA